MNAIKRYMFVVSRPWRWWVPWRKPVLGLQEQKYNMIMGTYPRGSYAKTEDVSKLEFQCDMLEQTLRQTESELIRSRESNRTTQREREKAYDAIAQLEGMLNVRKTEVPSDAVTPMDVLAGVSDDEVGSDDGDMGASGV